MPSDLEEAVEELRKRPAKELREARKRQRRALKALREGGYDALPEETREQLAQQFRTSLTALNKALEASTSDPQSSPEASDKTSSLFQGLLSWLR